MSEDRLSSRIVSALVGFPLLTLIIWLGLPWFSIAVAFIAGLMAFELTRMARSWGDAPMSMLAITCTVALIVSAHFLANGHQDYNKIVPVLNIVSVASILWLIRITGPRTKTSSWIISLAIVFYTGGLLFHAPLLITNDQGKQWVLLLLLTTFASDTGAFFFGKAFGKKPLAPSISPSKTLEGSGAGVVAAIAITFLGNYLLDLGLGMWKVLILGMLLGTVGQLGDLLVSRLKRIAGVKNSGRLLLGHGGILDRMDSIVFNLVVVYYFVL